MRTAICKFLLVLLFSMANMLSGRAAPDGGFLFVTFQNERSPMSEQIYFALSQDGRHWEMLNGDKPVLTSEVGEQGVRDPFLLRSHDGTKFYLIATNLSIFRNHNWKRSTHAGSKSIVIWDSPDLVHWSEPRLVQVAPDDAGCTWAPEAIWDDQTQDYLVFWASTTGSDDFGKQRIWACHTSDFVTFEKPFIYVEKPNHVIDADILQANGKYYRFTKDESHKAVTMEVSDKVDGPWQEISNFSLAHMTGYEGPECFLLSPPVGTEPGTWCLLLDHYAKGSGYEPFVTSDIASGNFIPATDFKFPRPMRHGSVLPLSKEEFERVENAYNKEN